MDALRRTLLRDETVIDDLDPGAGTQLRLKELQVRHVASTAVSSREKCEWLFRVLLMLQPKNVLELGTSLGVSALYMAGALPDAAVYTMEGRPSIIQVARKNISSASASNITLIEGDFKETLPAVLNQLDYLDFVVLDGNHQYAPTMKYMELVMSAHQPAAVLVDDIYWSKEMTKAWVEIKKIKHFNVQIDFYEYGLLLHRPEINEAISLSFIDYHKKFWRMGFWG